MAVYEVYIPPAGDAGGGNAENARYVADRASVLALIFPFVWLLWHRLWFWLAAYVLVAFFLSALGATSLAVLGAALTFLPGLYIYLEGPNMIANKLELQGWRLAGLVEAANEDAAATRWLERVETVPGILASAGSVESGSLPVAPNRPVRLGQAVDRPEFGLFAED